MQIRCEGREGRALTTFQIDFSPASFYPQFFLFLVLLKIYNLNEDGCQLSFADLTSTILTAKGVRESLPICFLASKSCCWVFSYSLHPCVFMIFQKSLFTKSSVGFWQEEKLGRACSICHLYYKLCLAFSLIMSCTDLVLKDRDLDLCFTAEPMTYDPPTQKFIWQHGTLSATKYDP